MQRVLQPQPVWNFPAQSSNTKAGESKLLDTKPRSDRFAYAVPSSPLRQSQRPLHQLARRHEIDFLHTYQKRILSLCASFRIGLDYIPYSSIVQDSRHILRVLMPGKYSE